MPEPKRILVHDYSGHPFQVQLSRALARRGHEVLHLYSAAFQTPKGALRRQADDPPTFSVEGLKLDEPFAKYSFVKRRRQEIEYGKLTAQRMRFFAPDVVIASNLPLDPLHHTQRACAERGASLIVWLQDLYSVAMRKILPRKLPMLGDFVARHYESMERKVLREADRVVCITDDFIPHLGSWGVAGHKCEVIENWAPLDEIVPVSRGNAWAEEQGLLGKRVVLYSGTLSLKHNPASILTVARRLADLEDVRVVVVSEGIGADWLKKAKAEQELENLLLLPFQPYGRFSEVLGAASVLLAIIEPDAGIFSVPSKVLSYLSSGRPIVLAVPSENLAARTVVKAGAGMVVAPDDGEALAIAVLGMLSDPLHAERCGANARQHAESAFDIGRIADRFESLLPGRTPVSLGALA